MRRVFATVAAIALAVVAWGVISTTHRATPTVSESVVPVALVRVSPDGAAFSDPTPSLGDVVGLTWLGQAPEAADIRFERDGSWSQWIPLMIDSDHEPDSGTVEAANTKGASEPTAFRDASLVQVRVRGGDQDSVALSFVDVSRPGPSGAPALADVSIHPRSEWDPANQCPPRRTPEEIQIDIAFVHHTGIDRAYTSAEVPDILLGYCLYHRNTRGWDDIAYNFLVDRFGRVWEGRAGGTDKGIRGGHTKGFNVYSTGIALIGNYTMSAPGSTEQQALTDLLAWKLEHHNIDPVSQVTVISQGSTKWAAGASVTLDAISGHRDAQATACPGIYCYNLLGQFRSVVDADVVNSPIGTYLAPASGDFNGDGTEDGLVLRASDSTWQFTDGATGTTSGWGTSVQGLDVTFARSVDLNGDGLTDLLVAGTSELVELISTGSGFTAATHSLPAAPISTGRARTDTGVETYALLADGSILVGPDLTWVGTISGPVDADVGDIDGDGFDELAVLRSNGDVVISTLGRASPLSTATKRVSGADRIVAGRFAGASVVLAAIDAADGDISLLRPSGSGIDVFRTLNRTAVQAVTDAVVVDSGSVDRLVVLDSYRGEWKEADFHGGRSYVTPLENQVWRTHVTVGSLHSSTSFLSWYGREFGWMRTTIGYGQEPGVNVTTRVAGATPYETNVALTQFGFDSADEAVLATSTNFPDALAAGVVAARLGGPLLVTDPDVLPDEIANEIVRLGVTRVTIAGGPAAVSDAVADAIAALGVEVRRIGGADRYETAALLSQVSFASADTVYIATGRNFPDALAGVPAAARSGSPILLVSDVVPAATLAEIARLNPTTIKILGGPAAVSSEVEDALVTATGAGVVRLGGADRYETSRIVSADSFGTSVDHVFLATGASFLDALIAGPIAFDFGAPVLLSRDEVSGALYAEVERLRPDRIILVGADMTSQTAASLSGIGPSAMTAMVAWLPR